MEADLWQKAQYSHGRRQPASSLNEARKTLGVMTCVEPVDGSEREMFRQKLMSHPPD